MKAKLLFSFCALLLHIMLQQPLQAQAWKLLGNSGTNPATQFLGTKDNKALVLRTNNIERLRISGAGNIGIGVANPLQKLHVKGNINIDSGFGLYMANRRVLFVDSIKGNIFLGNGTGAANSNGLYNTANGYYALKSNTTGYSNIANGYHALYSNTTGYNNTANGLQALYSNTTGHSNSANGYLALYSNTTGLVNTANGGYALYSNTNGSNNTANGYTALRYNSTGSYNTANGNYALYSNTTGLASTANGVFALYSNTTGNNNTANGYQSLYSNTTSSNNTANGVYALYFNTGGSNTANGYAALYFNSTGYSNTGNGVYALYSNTTGYNNTANGYYALNFNTLGHSNTAIGNYTLSSNTTGGYNTANGYQSLSSNTTGSSNTALGGYADVSIVNLKNATAIGYDATVDAGNKVRIGNAFVTSIGGQVGWTTFSDGRYKKNIKEDVKGLVFINSLRPVTYTVDINSLNAYYGKGKKHDSAYETAKAGMQESADEVAKIVYNGFIAQDVEAAAKKLNYDFSGVDKPQSEDGVYGLRYGDFVVPLVKAVQELSTKNNELKKEYDAKIDDLIKQITELKAMIAAGNTAQNKNAITLSNASLEQNIPNPFNNTTTVNYTLPQTSTSARLIITDKRGKALKEINVSGNGKGSLKIDASTLSSGAYQYSLYVDGKLTDTKQMILTK